MVVVLVVGVVVSSFALLRRSAVLFLRIPLRRAGQSYCHSFAPLLVLLTIQVVTKQFPPTVLVIVMVIVLVVGVVVSSFARRRPAYIRHLIM